MPCLQEETANTVGSILQHYVAELEATKKVFHFLSVSYKHRVKIIAIILVEIIFIFFISLIYSQFSIYPSSVFLLQKTGSSRWATQ